MPAITSSTGYTAAVTQNFGEHLSATLMYGSMGALTADKREIVSNNPDELRSMIRAGRKHAATARVTATVPRTGTHLIASYQWLADRRWVMPGNIYSTQAFRPMPGLNMYIRQPIPGLLQAGGSHRRSAQHAGAGLPSAGRR